MNDQQLLRYSRQIMLPEIDIEGQQRLLDARALIIGLGGLGSPVAMYLTAAGVGTLQLVDFDTVDLSNLQRQIVHASAEIGHPKVESAARCLHELNPDTKLILSQTSLQGEALAEAVASADVVLDCSDNFTTRFALNAACASQRTALVSGAAIRFEGQVSSYDLRRTDGPCYRCLYRDEGELDAGCTQNGVLAPLLGMIGGVQACEAIKLLTGIGQTLHGRLLLLDALEMEWRSIRLRPDPDCPVCASRRD